MTQCVYCLRHEAEVYVAACEHEQCCHNCFEYHITSECTTCHGPIDALLSTSLPDWRWTRDAPEPKPEPEHEPEPEPEGPEQDLPREAAGALTPNEATGISEEKALKKLKKLTKEPKKETQKETKKETKKEPKKESKRKPVQETSEKKRKRKRNAESKEEKKGAKRPRKRKGVEVQLGLRDGEEYIDDIAEEADWTPEMLRMEKAAVLADLKERNLDEDGLDVVREDYEQQIASIEEYDPKQEEGDEEEDTSESSSDEEEEPSEEEEEEEEDEYNEAGESQSAETTAETAEKVNTTDTTDTKADEAPRKRLKKDPCRIREKDLLELQQEALAVTGVLPAKRNRVKPSSLRRW
jgi:hypothetical protein